MGITLTVSTKADIEMKLRSWHDLEKRRQFLERKIPELEERLQRLASKLSKDGILSSIIQQTENMDMPRGNDVTDRVGNAVAEALDEIASTTVKLNEWREELAKVYAEIADIEYHVYMLKDAYQRAIIMYYRDGVSQYQVADAIYVSRTRVQKMIEKGKKSLVGMV